MRSMTLTEHRIMSPGRYFLDPGGPIRSPMEYPRKFSQQPFKVLLVANVTMLFMLIWVGLSLALHVS